MKSKSIKRHLFFSYFLIIGTTIIITIFFTVITLRALYLEKSKRELFSNLVLFEKILQPKFLDSDTKNFTKLKDLAKQIQLRLTILNLKGKVIFDSEKSPEYMDNHLNRLEVKNALQNKIGTSIRFSDTLHEDMLYVAKSLVYQGKTTGVLRIAEPLTLLNRQVHQAIIFLVILGTVISFFAMLIAYFISRKITNPFKELISILNDYSQADFKPHFIESNIAEINQITNALHAMSEELSEKIKAIVKEKLEKESILNNMMEGVITIDRYETVININKAALSLLKLDPKICCVYFQEIIRNPELNELIKRVLAEPAQIRKEIYLAQTQIYLQISISSLINESEKIIGAIIVLNDISRLKEAETLEKAFVANVSHELKTPLTVIKGFVETLMNGSVKKQADYLNFLEIINRHLTRLGDIINDLLTLSKVEDQKSVNFEKTSLAEVVRKALDICATKAEAKKIKINIDLEQDFILPLNPLLIEQAIINLIDNAVQYSAENSTITIKTGKNQDQCWLLVSDEGIGIAENHLPHLFKRFYRVDKSRSRESGGTGLGLAIAKHILDLHKARIEVKSTLGQGSDFYVYFSK